MEGAPIMRVAPPSRPASAPAVSKLPLLSHVYYLDVSEKKKQSFTKQIEFLGGRVIREFDLSKITHVLTSRVPRQDSASAARDSLSSIQPHQTVDRSPSPLNGQKLLARSNGGIQRPESPAAGVFAMVNSRRTLQLASVISNVESAFRQEDVLTLAKQHEKTIYHVEKMGPFLDHWCSKILHERELIKKRRTSFPTGPKQSEQQPSTANATPPMQPSANRAIRAPTPTRPVPNLSRLPTGSSQPAATRHPYVMVRDKCGYFAPATKEFPPAPAETEGSTKPTFPQLHLENPPGTSLFVQLSVSDREAELEKARTRKRKYDECQLDESLRREYEETRRKKLKVRPDKENLFNFPMRPKAGYCECCAKKYDDFDTHVMEDVHRQFAQDASNYAELDKLIEEINCTT